MQSVEHERTKALKDDKIARMESMFEPDSLPWIYQSDWFSTEVENFQRDAHMLILTTVDAAAKHLTQEAKEQDDELSPHIENANGAGLERIGEIQAEIWGYIGDQERYARNMALVALISRLTHSLNVLARKAESFSPRNKKGYVGDNEFCQLWNEYSTRFGIRFASKHIQFIEPLRSARNRIVHNGGEANPPKSFDELVPDDEGGVETYNLRFSKKYPQFVQGVGHAAEVVITQEQLDRAITSCAFLLGYAAGELRCLELAHAKREMEEGVSDDLYKRMDLPAPSKRNAAGALNTC